MDHRLATTNRWAHQAVQPNLEEVAVLSERQENTYTQHQLQVPSTLARLLHGCREGESSQLPPPTAR